ncbi:MAG TPA: sialidase family protein [Candidatus Limnocylindrales bacterium]
MAFNSLFVSQDDGKTFVRQESKSPDANIVWDALAFETPQQGVVVVGPTSEGLIHTSDGGATWTKSALPSMPRPGSFELGDPVVAGSTIEIPMSTQSATSANVSSFTFLVSTDGGATFSNGPVLNLPDGQSVSASDGQRTWVVSSTGATIYESADNGQTWASVKAKGLPQNLASLALAGAHSATAVVATHGCTGVKTGCWQNTYLISTTDDGRTWSQLTTN